MKKTKHPSSSQEIQYVKISEQNLGIDFHQNGTFKCIFYSILFTSLFIFVLIYAATHPWLYYSSPKSYEVSYSSSECKNLSILEESRAIFPISKCPSGALRGLVIQQFSSHREVLPSSILFMELLGVKCVDVIVNKDNDFGIFKLLHLFGMDVGVHRVESIQSEFDWQASFQDLHPHYVLLQTFLGGEWERGQTVFPKNPVLFIGHHGEGYNCVYRPRRTFVLNYFPQPYGLEMLPFYMGPHTYLHQPRERVHFVIPGQVTFKKRDYNLLKTIPGTLRRNVKIILFGRMDNTNDTTMKFRDLQNHLGDSLEVLSGDFEVMMSVMHSTDFIMPLIGPRSPSSYFAQRKMSSSVSLSLAFEKPLVIWRTLKRHLNSQGLSLSDQIDYGYGDGSFLTAIHQSMSISKNEPEYHRISQSLLFEKRRKLCHLWSQLENTDFHKVNDKVSRFELGLSSLGSYFKVDPEC